MPRVRILDGLLNTTPDGLFLTTPDGLFLTTPDGIRAHHTVKQILLKNDA